jgi:hypothetical protein
MSKELNYKIDEEELDYEELDYEELNDDWINSFEDNDKLYKDFYKDNLYYINIDFIYVNKNNEIEKIKQESFLMSVHNSITRDELIGLLKRNSIDNDKRYSLLSILKYNITLDADDIKHFLSSDDFSSYNQQFLTVNKHIDTIFFEKTINMFQDLNNIYFIFHEKTDDVKKRDLNSVTKKIYLGLISSTKENKKTHRKTIRKQ